MSKDNIVSLAPKASEPVERVTLEDKFILALNLLGEEIDMSQDDADILIVVSIPEAVVSYSTAVPLELNAMLDVVKTTVIESLSGGYR